MEIDGIISGQTVLDGFFGGVLGSPDGWGDHTRIWGCWENFTSCGLGGLG